MLSLIEFIIQIESIGLKALVFMFLTLQTSFEKKTSRQHITSTREVYLDEQIKTLNGLSTAFINE